MKWFFEAVAGQSELSVTVQKVSHDEEVQALMDYLAVFGEPVTEVIPVKLAEKIQLVQVADLIAVEVEAGELVLTTRGGALRTMERLTHFQERVNHPDLLQISRYGLINLRHLNYLEASFSGNMTAFLTNKTKVTVSRRYLKTLEKKLGL